MATKTQTDIAPEPDETEFVAAPVADVDAPYGYKADGTPKKRPGRPKGSTNTGGGTTRRPRSTSLKNQIGGLLITLNMPLAMFFAKDALDQVEIEALATSIDAQAQSNPRFKKYVEQAIQGVGGTSLIAVVAMIVARRAVRHDILPVPPEVGKDNIDGLIGTGIAMLGGSGNVLGANISTSSE